LPSMDKNRIQSSITLPYLVPFPLNKFQFC
jgi:hypothetical protein